MKHIRQKQFLLDSQKRKIQEDKKLSSYDFNKINNILYLKKSIQKNLN